MTIYSKTAKGLREASGKTKNLTREMRELLKLVNGKLSLEELRAQLDDDDQDALEPCLESLVEEEYIHELEASTFQPSAPPPPQPKTAATAKAAVAKPPPATEEAEGDLDFFAAPVASPAPVPAPVAAKATPPAAGAQDATNVAAKLTAAKAEEQTRLAAQEKEKAQQAVLAQQKLAAETKARQEAETKAKQESEAKAKQESEAKAKQEAETKAKQAAVESQRLEAVAAQKREAEETAKRAANEKAELERRSKAEQEQQARQRAEAEKAVAAAASAAAATAAAVAAEAAVVARQEAEDKIRREAAEIVRRENEERDKREAADRQRTEAGERAKKAYEDKLRREAEEKAKRDAEDQARRDEVERLRLETDRLRAELEQQRVEAETKAKIEAEERARVAAEGKAQREVADRQRAEEAERLRIAAAVKAEQDATEQRRRDAEEGARRAAAEQERKEAEARERVEAEKRARVEADERAQRAEETAKRDAAEKLQRETEQRQRAEAEAQSKREADEHSARAAQEKSKTDAETAARHEAEEQQRIVADEQARSEKQAHERHEVEAKSRQEIEDAKWREEELARREAEAQLEREQVRREQDEVIEREAISRPRSGKSGGWGKRIAVLLVVLIVAGLGVIHVLSFDGQKAIFEQAASAQFNQPVKIKSLHVSLVPQVHWRADGVSIGDKEQIRIASVNAGTSLGALSGKSAAVSSLALDSVTINEEGLAWLLFGAAQKGSLVLPKLVATNVTVSSTQLLLPVLEVSAESNADGVWQKLIAQSADRKFIAEFERNGNAVALKLDSPGYAPPAGFSPDAVTKARSMSLTDFRAVATLSNRQLTVNEFSGGALDGVIAGTARMTWDDGILLSSELTAKRIGITSLLPTLFDSGTVNGSGSFGMSGTDPIALQKSVRGDGSFLIERGELRRVDLGKVLQGGSSSGKTAFSTMGGRFVYGDGKTQLSGVKLFADLVTANGNAELAADNTVGGRFVVELKSSKMAVRGNLSISGSLTEPQFSR